MYSYGLGCSCCKCGSVVRLSDTKVNELAKMDANSKFTHECDTCGVVEHILTRTEKERVDAANKYPGPKDFVHLHNHTIYSALDGVAKPEEYFEGCHECDLPAFAITDHGSIAAAPDAYFAAKKHNVKYIAGCFLPNQDVLTSDGVKSIDSIVPGDIVLTDKCRWKKVLNVQERQYDGDIVRVSSWGIEDVVSTEEHPFLVREVIRENPKRGVWLDNIDTKWIKASELEVVKYNRTSKTKKSFNKNNKRRFKHYLCLPRIIGNGISNIDIFSILSESYGSAATLLLDGNTIRNIKYNHEFGGYKDVNLPSRIPLNNELLWIFGLWLAEGSFSKYSNGIVNSINFSLGYDELSFANKIKDYFGNFNINVGIRERKLDNNPRNVIDVTVYSAYFARIFINLFGDHFDKKKIPFDWINNLSNDQKFALLQGLFDGDAKIDEYNNNLKLCNKTLIWQSRLLMWSLGYTSAISKIKNNNSDNYGYNIRFRNKGRFYYDIGDKYIYSPICDISTSKYNGIVYNIEVEDDNSYCVGPIVHNCEVYLNDFEPEFKEWQAAGNNFSNLELPELREFAKMNDLRVGAPELYGRIRRNRHLTILAKNDIGYRNLITIQNKAWETGFYYKPRVSYDLLREHKDGLIILSGCLNGPICHELRADVPAVPTSRTIRRRLRDTTKMDEKFYAPPKLIALEWIKQFKEDFGDDFYLEIQMPGESIPNGRRAFRMIAEIGRRMGHKVVLTNDCHYTNRDDYKIQMVMMAVDQDKKIDDPTLFHVNSDEQFFKTRAQMRKTFIENKYTEYSTIEEFEQYCDNTMEIHEKCSWFSPNLEPKLPEVPDADRELVKKTHAALVRMGLHEKPEYVERMKLELQRFIEKRFSSYFLITEDLVNKSKANGEPVGPARGSAGGSLVCYLLGIHEMDPIAWNLSFDRFLSPSRGGYMLATTM